MECVSLALITYLLGLLRVAIANVPFSVSGSKNEAQETSKQQ